MPSFAELGLAEPICRALDPRQYPLPTIIQVRAIPPLLEGRDLLAVAPLGAGKTAAYLLPMVHRLADPAVAADPKEPRAIVLTSARDRAEAIGRGIETFARFVPVRHVAAADAGSWNKQSKELRTGVEIVVTTPKQLIELMKERAITLHAIEFIVLDDADEMLERNMWNELERVFVDLPEQRQTALFGADAEAMKDLARVWLREPIAVDAPAPKKKKARRGKGEADAAPTEPPVDLPQWLDEPKPPVRLPGWLDESGDAAPPADAPGDDDGSADTDAAATPAPRPKPRKKKATTRKRPAAKKRK